MTATETPTGIATRELTYLRAFNEGLRQVMREDPDVFVAGEDVGAQGGEAEECARAAANDQGGGFVINSSRGIIYASRNPEDFDYEAGRAAELLRDQINDALKPDGLNPQTILLE